MDSVFFLADLLRRGQIGTWWHEARAAAHGTDGISVAQALQASLGLIARAALPVALKQAGRRTRWFKRTQLRHLQQGYAAQYHEAVRPAGRQPSVLAEAAEEYFDIPQVDRHLPARFMLLVVPVLNDKQDAIPAVNHMGTARIQTVYRDVSPMYHQLIQSFGQVSGTPVLLNTSFNVRGEPIVNSPEDALNTFVNSGIDTLVMGNYMLDKSE